ncbi:MAG: class I SAM-dependent methyltransferase, partial [Candidatus Heimdallarchaeaceae archaeon]
MAEKPEPNWAFKIMSFIHDNAIRQKFGNPKKILKAAHLKEGQIVLEIGCGPGFFTLPAAEIVGEKG